MMSFNDFIRKYKIKNKATPYTKINQLFSAIGLDNVDIHLRDWPFSSDVGIVNLHPVRGFHWVLYISQNYFDSYGCSSPQKLSKFIIKRNGHCLFSEYKIQDLKSKRDS